MSKQIFSRDGVTVTSFCKSVGQIAFQVTWGVGRYMQTTSRQQAFAVAFAKIKEVQ